MAGWPLRTPGRGSVAGVTSVDAPAEIVAGMISPQQRSSTRRATARADYLSCSMVSAIVVPKQATAGVGWLACASRWRSSFTSAPRARR